MKDKVKGANMRSSAVYFSTFNTLVASGSTKSCTFGLNA